MVTGLTDDASKDTVYQNKDWVDHQPEVLHLRLRWREPSARVCPRCPTPDQVGHEERHVQKEGKTKEYEDHGVSESGEEEQEGEESSSSLMG